MMRSYCHPRFQLYYSQSLFDSYPTDPQYRNDRLRVPEYPRRPLPSSLPLEHSSPPSSPPSRPLTLPPRIHPSPSHLKYAPEPSQASPEPAHPSPSPSYLDFASEPSKTLSEPTRKLLILDLNGTLLLRSPRALKSNRGQHQQAHPAPRRVLPRPYITALRAYLFASRTRAWLDVMVWSSAQPHSVDDMVLHTLGDDRERLVAIWARDTLGLTADHYHRKVQTIKDLEKPWAALTPTSSTPVNSSKLQPTRSSPKRTSHSAATTLLLDDSHAKAALQPYNHVCIPEYTRTQRNADVAVLQFERSVQQPQQQQQQQESSSVSHQEDSPVVPIATTNTNAHELPVSSPDSLDGEKDQSLKRKRKKTKVKVLQAQAMQQQQLAVITASAGRASPTEFDETLLAVIGILHALRLQSSIAGWIHAGALSFPHAPLSEPAGVVGDGDVKKTWCDDPVLVRAWASRGREAMHELGLKVEHGLES